MAVEKKPFPGRYPTEKEFNRFKKWPPFNGIRDPSDLAVLGSFNLHDSPSLTIERGIGSYLGTEIGHATINEAKRRVLENGVDVGGCVCEADKDSHHWLRTSQRPQVENIVILVVPLTTSR